VTSPPPIDVQHPPGEVEPPECAEPVPETCRARGGEHRLAVVRDAKVNGRVRERYPLEEPERCR
jgi:hypothetical protein